MNGNLSEPSIKFWNTVTIPPLKILSKVIKSKNLDAVKWDLYNRLCYCFSSLVKIWEEVQELISIILSLGLGVVGSIIGNFLYDKLTKKSSSKNRRTRWLIPKSIRQNKNPWRYPTRRGLFVFVQVWSQFLKANLFYFKSDSSSMIDAEIFSCTIYFAVAFPPWKTGRRWKVMLTVLIITVAANVTSYFICKWLEKRRKK